MENINFPVSTPVFVDGIFRQIGRFSVRDLVLLFEKSALGDTGAGTGKIKCAIRMGDDDVVFCVPKNELFVGTVAGVFAGQSASGRARICRKLLKSILENPDFEKSDGRRESVASAELEFPLSMGADELSRINLEKIDRKSLVALKKKILDVMLGGGSDVSDKGRPIGGSLVVQGPALGIQFSPEQAISVLKKSLFKLGSDRLVELDSKLGGAITSMPGDRE